MHLKRALLAGIASSALALAQSPSTPRAAGASMRQLMLDLIYPAANEILLLSNRGGPKTEEDWAAARRSAITLAESGNLLLQPGRARDQGNWAQDVKALVDAGNAAYQAAQAKDPKALAAVAEPLDRSCTACHQQYRPNVFRRDD